MELQENGEESKDASHAPKETKKVFFKYCINIRYVGPVSFDCPCIYLSEVLLYSKLNIKRFCCLFMEIVERLICGNSYQN